MECQLFRRRSRWHGRSEQRDERTSLQIPTSHLGSGLRAPRAWRNDTCPFFNKQVRIVDPAQDADPALPGLLPVSDRRDLVGIEMREEGHDLDGRKLVVIGDGKPVVDLGLAAGAIGCGLGR